jgi:tetratricopeptide (TPR) repeat protein
MSSQSHASLPKQPLTTPGGSHIPDPISAQHLRKILQSATLRDSESLKRFLEYSVERTLLGEGGQLKEYRVGMEVFNRSSSFDPRLDPVVRMTARRLRSKLREYYEGEGRDDLIRIEIPKGSYGAAFSFNGNDTASRQRFTSVPKLVLSNNSEPELSAPFAVDRALPRSFRTKLFARNRVWAAAGILTAGAVLVLILVRGIFSTPRTVELGNGKVLIADITNSTGEPVFDETLKQAIAVDLSQSPLLEIISEAKIRATLKLMSREVDTRISPELARDVCQRSAANAYIIGSIQRLGSQYVIGLNALNCRTGDVLAQEQASAMNQERVLNTMHSLSTKLRQKLGESAKTIEKFDLALDQVTTPSLEALKAYSLGNQARDRRGDAAAIPFFRRAIELDPDFALALDAIGVSYSNLDEPGLASENIAKAFSRRNRASERERFEIGADYSQIVTGDLDKANEICQEWAQAYPLDEYPHDLLGLNYEFLGKYEEAIAEMSKAIQLNPDGVILYSNLMEAQTALNRLQDAKQTYRLAIARKLDHPYLHADMYGLAFLEANKEEMSRQVSWASSQSGGEDLLLSLESDSAASAGMLREARKDSRRAVKSALWRGGRETAALWQMNSALREAEFGNFVVARQQMAAALRIASTRDVRVLAALTLARTGEATTAQAIADNLAAQFPANVVINRYWLPTIRAAIEIDRGNPGRAVDLLGAAAPYEMGYPNPQIAVGGLLYPAYIRGLALLQLKDKGGAEREFQKIVDARYVIGNSPLGTLARIGLARAHSGTGSQSCSAYQEFFSFWMNSDRDIPVLQQAHMEYAQLCSAKTSGLH